MAVALLLGALTTSSLIPPARAMSIVPPEFSDLVTKSDYVVRGTVKSVRCEWQTIQGVRRIHTLVELTVTQVIVGQPPSPLILRMLGGRVGDEVMEVEGSPQFTVGEDKILFVRGNGRQFIPLTAATHGVYPILRDGTGREYVARANTAPLRSTAEISQPLSEAPTRLRAEQVASALTPSAFIDQIRAAVSSHSAAAQSAK